MAKKPHPSTTPEFAYLEIGASLQEADLSVLLMHGLGADGHDFADVADALCQAASPRRWRFILPHAPEQPVTINLGAVMPAWYDILDLDHPRDVNWETVSASQRGIEAILQREQANNIVLAGFSQGAAMALHVGLRHQHAISGILMMSGYLLESAAHPPPTPAPGIKLPIALFHGDSDPVVPLQAATSALHSLHQLGFAPSLKQYLGLGHGVSEEEIRDVFDWLVETQHQD